MALSKQIHIYSLDTSCFYNEREMLTHTKMNQIYILRTQVKNYIEKLEKQLKSESNSEVEIKIDELQGMVSTYNSMLKHEKNRLYAELKNTKAIGEVRNLRVDTLVDRNIISVFESSLTRTMKLDIGKLSHDLMIVQTYYFDVIEDLIKDGYYYGDDKYVVLTASAGQIRTKKTVFIKESVWEEYQNTITCGLSVDTINKMGGVNVNKYLAYLALSNSATDVWANFNIDKAIVVDDFETLVDGDVDHVDEITYTITRKKMSIPIPHMDGCGIMMPKANNKKSTMVRLPWIKGLLVPFDFHQFIKDKRIEMNDNTIGIVKDVKGKEYDIINDDIQYIFTASQWKMYKYYNSWDEYVNNFKKYGCEACKCNEEEDRICNAKINYQMLQTLTDMTDDELSLLARETVDSINSLGSDRGTMLKILGVVDTNTNKTYLQQALQIYPELLRDTYCKDILKQVKKSLVKEARAGKLFIDGKYTFLIPDLYAFCEWLFLGIESPQGLLGDGEVYCNLYKDGDKLDVLRSPHLYREHAVRKNVIDSEKKRWLVSKGIYTSVKDMISRILQFDNDGDKALVCRDKTLVNVAERNMEGIVPLYYDMKKAPAQELNKNTTYDGLKLAYTGGNIGIYSNDISKIWNSKNPNLEVIKLLCCENNFVIDYAKTLYKPDRPKRINKIIRDYTKKKVPHFFIYAKDKEPDQVARKTKSVVNRLENIIPKPTLRFNANNIGKFDYKKLLNNRNFKMKDDCKDILSLYDELNMKKHFIDSKEDIDNDVLSQERYVYRYIRERLLEVNNDEKYVTDVLIEYLYNITTGRKKDTLWYSFGDVIVENLKKNIDEIVGKDVVLCEVCGERVEYSNSFDRSRKYCSDDCFRYAKLERDRINARNRYNSRKAN